jgi:[ribosomal protein S5]-alanine N-acetyltransferase
MEIYSEGILLRPWSIIDAARLASIANNKNIADNLRDGFPYPYSIVNDTSWLNMIIPENDPPRFFAITIEGRIIGSIGLVSKSDIYRKNMEIGYYISEDFWGRGIAAHAIKAVTSYAFRNFDIIRVYAEPFSDNKGSRKALEKAGFKHEATLKSNVIKNGIIKDTCIYAVLKDDFNWPDQPGKSINT